MPAMGRGFVDADLLALARATRDSGEELLLDVFAELESDRIVVVVLVADIAGVGPGEVVRVGAVV